MVPADSIAMDLDQILAGSRNGDRLAQCRLYECFRQTVYALAVNEPICGADGP